jgi:hypothetical protein
MLGRLRNMGDWLAYLLQRLLAEKRHDWQAVEPGQLDLALVDGSVICGPASKGSDWRLHARFDPGHGCFGDLVLSEGRIAEQVDRTQISPGQTMIQDRGYARVRNFAGTEIGSSATFLPGPITRLPRSTVTHGNRKSPLHRSQMSLAGPEQRCAAPGCPSRLRLEHFPINRKRSSFYLASNFIRSY